MVVGGRVTYAGRATVAVVRRPYEGIERAVERVAEKLDRRNALPRYEATGDWEARLHGQLGAGWPCKDAAEFDLVWSDTTKRLHDRGLRMGKGAFGGWDDGDRSFARAAWCLVAHYRPRVVLETGVGRGLTSRCILEGLIRNSQGHLWSIDLPPLIARRLALETGLAVDDRCRGAWTLVSGSSRRRLGALVRELGGIDMFVHDSSHTTRNLRFELDRVWPVLRPGAFSLVDDIDVNRVFATSQDVANAVHVIGPHEERAGLFGIARKAAIG